MANTRSSAKRAEQSKKRQERNQKIRTATRTAVREALQAMKQKSPDPAQLAAGHQKAARALDQAASKGVIPRKRASRKISRLTLLRQKILAQATQKSS